MFHVEPTRHDLKAQRPRRHSLHQRETHKKEKRINLFRIILSIDRITELCKFTAVFYEKQMENLVAHQLNERLATSGLRSTVQRQQVYDVLLQKRDHPTAEEVFMRAKQSMPEISIATVYNCLDALVKCSLVRQVNLDRSATRYCPNMHEHFHFYCDQCGTIYDIDAPKTDDAVVVQVPDGFSVGHCEISIRGSCPACNANDSASTLGS